MDSVLFKNSSLLAKVLCKHRFKILFRRETHPLLQNIAVGIEQIEFGLIMKTEGALKAFRARVTGIEISEHDLPKVFRFEPMNHGRHGTAGASSEAEKFHQLQSF